MDSSKVILSTPLLLVDGVYKRRTIGQEEAVEWVATHSPKNFCGHQTVKILGIEPSTSREACTGFSEALCLKPKGRLDFGREYSLEEIKSVGVEFVLLTFLGE
jgi:hypothetical protein